MSWADPPDLASEKKNYISLLLTQPLMHIRQCSILLLGIILPPLCLAEGCAFEGGALPAPGDCAGPLSRALSRLAAVKAQNYGCGASQVPFAANGSLHCGECSPSWHGLGRFTGSLPSMLPTAYFASAPASARFKPSATVPLWQCNEDQYCSSKGECRELLRSPLAGQLCDAENAQLRCPVGLTCIARRCRVCVPDVPFRSALATSEAAYCADGLLHASAAAPFREPDTVLATAIFCVAALVLLMLSCIAACKRWTATRSGLLQLIDQDE